MFVQHTICIYYQDIVKYCNMYALQASKHNHSITITSKIFLYVLEAFTIPSSSYKLLLSGVKAYWVVEH